MVVMQRHARCDAARVPCRLDGRSWLIRWGEEGVAIAFQQRIHMAQEHLHLAIAAACPVVHCHLSACHLIKHHLYTIVL